MTIAIAAIVTMTLFVSSLLAATTYASQKALAASTPNATSPGVNTINTTMLGKPYFEGKGKTLGIRVIDVNSGSPKVEYVFSFGGLMNGVNVTVTETALVAFRANGSGYGAGQGIIMTNDGEVATYNGQGFGQATSGGTTIVHGLHIYNTASTAGKLAFLNKVVGVEEYDLGPTGNVSIKEWAWKQNNKTDAISSFFMLG